MRRRLAVVLPLVILALLVLAPAAFGHLDGGEGTYGETDDKVVTNAGFILIGFFPLLVFALSMLQWRLEKRKDARKKAAKARASRGDLSAGW
jgi:hypothetical protein